MGMKPASVSGSNSTTVGSPLEALEHDEIMRTRLFCLVALCVAFAGGGAALVLPGDPTISALLLASVGVALVAIIFLYMRTRDPIAFVLHRRAGLHGRQAIAGASAGRRSTGAAGRPRRSA